MRCPQCDTPNDEGAARCANCDQPLTAYSGQLTGLVSEATRAKAARLAIRPPIIGVMAVLDALTAVLFPFGTVIAAFRARPTVNAEGTNYIGAAFGAVGVTFIAAVLIPLGIALLVIAWATWTQKTWAWMTNAALLVISGVLAVIAFPHEPVQALIRIALSGAVAFFWFKNETKEWYGVNG